MSQLNKKTPQISFSQIINSLIIYSTCIASLLAIIFFRIFYTNANLHEFWSFKLNDVPWTPPGISPIPIIGEHYFGDFQLTLLFEKLPNAYAKGLTLPYGIPPLSLPLIHFFNFFSMRFAFLLFLILSTFLFALVIWIALPNLEKNLRKLATILLVTCSLPLYVAFDRGNFSVIAICCFWLALSFSHNQDAKISNLSPRIAQKLCLITLLVVISTSFKHYLIVPLAISMFAMRSFYLFWSLLITGIGNLVCSVFIPGGPLEVFKNMSDSASIQLGLQTPTWLLGGVGPNQLFLNSWISISGHVKEIAALEYQPFTFIWPIAWILVSIYSLYHLPKDHYLLKLIMLSGVHFLPPVANVYTLVWTSIALAIVLNELWKAQISERILLKKLAAILVICCLPIPLTNTHLPFPLNDYREIPSIFVLLLLLQITLNVKRVKNNVKEK